MNDARLRNLPRPFRPVRRNGQIDSRSPQFDQLTQCLRPAARRRASYGSIAESRHNLADQFAVAMLADQHVHFIPLIDQGNHQLPAMPERQDDMLALAIECLNRCIASNRHAHRLPQQFNHYGADGREQSESYSIEPYQFHVKD